MWNLVWQREKICVRKLTTNNSSRRRGWKSCYTAFSMRYASTNTVICSWIEAGVIPSLGTDGRTSNLDQIPECAHQNSVNRQNAAEWSGAVNLSIYSKFCLMCILHVSRPVDFCTGTSPQVGLLGIKWKLPLPVTTTVSTVLCAIKLVQYSWRNQNTFLVGTSSDIGYVRHITSPELKRPSLIV